MSSKHLRRLLDEKEKASLEIKRSTEGSEGEAEEETTVSRKPANRFAFIVDDDSPAEVDEESDGNEKRSSDDVIPQSPMTKKNKKKNKKKKKAGKASAETAMANDEDEDKLLDQLVEQNKLLNEDAASGKHEVEIVEAEQIFKVDPRLFDPSAELKRVLGKAFREEGTSSKKAPHQQWKGAGKIVKQKRNWPPIRSLGLTMTCDDTDAAIKWFRFEHNSYYEKLERMCWLGEDSYDAGMAQEILQDNFYHLNSLLMLGNVLRMQDDVTQAGDCIERGIFFCEQSFHPIFQSTSWSHRMDYGVYENRAFYLLLHRYMLNCVHKRCFETALNVAKLIFTMDPQRDPLAILLIIESIAIKARQYGWFKRMYATAREWKNLDLLPNIRYSLALAHFLSSDQKDREQADALLRDAIISFPGVVTQLLEELQIQADPMVESHSHLSVFAYNKEPDGLKLCIKVLVKQTAELWKVPDTLAWLERVTRDTVADRSHLPRMEEERLRRKRVFVGVPPNVRRLAVLLGMESSAHGVTDPEPPQNGTARYTRDDSAGPSAANQNMLAGLLQSLYPAVDMQESLSDMVRRLYNENFGAPPPEDQ